MTFRRALVLLSAVACLCASHFVRATELGAADYKAYYGDVNGDGIADIYLKAQPQILILHGDVAVPLALDPKGPNLLATGYTLSGVTYFFSLQSYADVDVSSLSATDFNYYSGDFNGDGLKDAFLQANNNSKFSLIIQGVAGTGVPTILQSLDSNLVASNVGTVKVEDQNNDGKDDIVVYQDGESFAGYLSSSATTLAYNRIWHYGDIDTGGRPTAVGAIGGSHSVGNDGSASYSIPITLAPGVAGMQPQLSFAYSSNGGSGVMGQGWGLNGQSSISRCPTTLVDDGFVDGVDFDSNDRFCLDGQPLVAVSGTYGANGTEYRTQTETFSKVVSFGAVGNCVRNGTNVPGPEKFLVTTKTGQTLEYGYTADSRVEAVGCNDVLEWVLNKQQDQYSNAVTYTYTEDAGEHTLARIDYNNGASHVEFEYTEREDQISGYLLGTPIKSTLLLKGVKTFEGSKLLREYLTAYELSGISQTAVLKTLVECTDSDCLPATSLTWGEDGTDTQLTYTQRISSTLCKDANTCDGDNRPSIQYPDINGDGFADFCFRGDPGIQCRLGTENGFTGTLISTTICKNYGSVCGQDTKYVNSIRFIDLNNDGLADIVYPGKNGVEAWYSTGTGFTFAFNSGICTGNGCDHDNYPSLQYPDINGDGYLDMCYRSDSGVRCYKGTGSGFNGGSIITDICKNYASSSHYGGCREYDGYPATLSFVDVDNDGMSDLVFRRQSGMSVYRSTGDSFVYHFNTSICPTSGTNCDHDNYDSLSYPDINGDGYADACVRYDNTGITCYTGTGSSWGAEVYSTNICKNGSSANGVCNGNDNHSTIRYVDINQDGKDDLTFRSDVGIRIMLSTGTGFVSTYSSSICANGSSSYGVCNDSNNYNRITWQDVTGDGMVDLLYRGDQGIQIWPLQNAQKNQLAEIKNGFNVATQFNYKLLTDSSIYTKGTESLSYPIAHVVGPMAVVDSVKQSNGIGGFSSTSYTYKGLKSHITGLGSLGFSEMVTKNDDTGIFTTVTFNQDYANRLQGSAERIVTNANGVITSDTQNTWQQSTIGSGSSTRYLPQLTQTTVTKRDLNGAFLHRETNDYTDTSGDPAYDAYGNIERMVSKLYDESNSLLRTTTTVNNYSNNESSWFIGQLTRAEVTTDVAGRAARKKVSGWEYDASNGRKLREQIRHPDTDLVLHQTAYGFDENGIEQRDSFGNNLAITVSGPDFDSRTSKVSFDSTGRYPLSKTNALGHSASTEYYSASDTSNGAFPGKPKVTTDANGIKTYSAYDSFGRTSSVTSAWGTSAAVTSSTQFNYCDASCPANAEYYIVNTVQGGSSSRSYVDKLGRELRKGSQSKKQRGGASEFVYIDYAYNGLGQNSQVTEPYFESDGPQYTHSMTYDVLNRSITTTRADGRIDAISYDGLTRTSLVDINDKLQSKTEVRNPMNELVKVIDTADNELAYSYDSHGNLLQTIDPLNNIVSINYDALGRKTSMNDPDKGVWSYTYNSLGQLISQTNARGETTCNAYDIAGRLVKRIDNYQGGISSAIGQVSDATNQCANDTSNPEVASWQYDSASGAALGKLHSVTGADGYQQIHSYDSLGRPQASLKTVNGQTYEVATSYDAYSRPLVSSYPQGNGDASNRLQVKNVYNELGMLTEVRNAANDALYFQLESLDARGNVTNETYGNGVETLRDYDAPTGYLTDIVTLTIGSASIDVQDFNFTFDQVGNLNYREDFLNNFREDFVYDNLNRLTQTNADFDRSGTNSSIQTTNVSYDVLGNILTKTGVGTYKYGSDCSTGFGPHAVCEISGGSIGSKNTSYTYDANGNMVTGDGRTIDYTLFDKPDVITKGNNKTELSYGPDRARYFRRDTVTGGGTNGADKVTDYTYVGGLYEKVEFKDDGTTVNKTEERHFIGGFAIVTLQDRSGASVGNSKTRYLHKDHLGSITAISDEVGNVAERFSFDAWGKRRGATLAEMEAEVGKSFASMSSFEKGNLTINPMALASNVTNKGFTGHEQMDGVGLIHMNGRVYDAEIGRFLSADPFVQDRTNLQALNRYSYVENNPLSYTDPSGYFLKKLKKAFKKAFKAIGKAINAVWKGIKTGVKSILKGIGKLINKVPGLQAVVTAAVCIMVPGACTAFIQAMALLNAAVNLANGVPVGQVLKGLAVAYVTSGMPGVGGGGWVSGAATKLTGHALVGAAVGAGVNAKAMGGKFIDGVKGFAVGAAITGALGWAYDQFTKPNVANLNIPQPDIDTEYRESDGPIDNVGEAESFEAAKDRKDSMNKSQDNVKESAQKATLNLEKAQIKVMARPINKALSKISGAPEKALNGITKYTTDAALSDFGRPILESMQIEVQTKIQPAKSQSELTREWKDGRR
jgi:RHS repeat-associated protein